MLAAFQVGRGDPSIDPCAECYGIPDVTVVADQVAVMALSTGLWPVAVLTPGVQRAVILTATATICRATGARASSAILKAIQAKF
jgi:hypothetical protein